MQLDKLRDLVRQKAPWTQNFQFLKKELQNRQEIRIRVKKRYCSNYLTSKLTLLNFTFKLIKTKLQLLQQYKTLREYLMEQAKQILEFKSYINGTKIYKSAKVYPEQFSECSQNEQYQQQDHLQKPTKLFLEDKGSQPDLQEFVV